MPLCFVILDPKGIQQRLEKQSNLAIKNFLHESYLILILNLAQLNLCTSGAALGLKIDSENIFDLLQSMQNQHRTLLIWSISPKAKIDGAIATLAPS